MKTFEKYFENITDPNVADTILSKLKSEEKGTINKELSEFMSYASEGNTPQIYEYVLTKTSKTGGSRRRRRPSRKYKKSAKRVFRKKSRSTRRR
jgi:hypothetical protein